MRALIYLVAISLFPSVGLAHHHDHFLVARAAAAVPGDSLYLLHADWSNQDGGVIQLDQLKGKPRIVAMVYTKCATACPLLVQTMKEVLARLPESLAKRVSGDLFSFDSETETAQSMREFRSKYRMPQEWTLYAGSKNGVAELAAALGIQYKKLPSGAYIHSNALFFLNEKGEVLAKQEGLGRDTAEFAKKIERYLQTIAKGE